MIWIRVTIKSSPRWKEKDLFDPQRFEWMEGQPFAEYIAGDSYGHYAEHAAQIREWRKGISEK